MTSPHMIAGDAIDAFNQVFETDLPNNPDLQAHADGSYAHIGDMRFHFNPLSIDAHPTMWRDRYTNEQIRAMRAEIVEELDEKLKTAGYHLTGADVVPQQIGLVRTLPSDARTQTRPSQYTLTRENLTFNLAAVSELANIGLSINLPKIRAKYDAQIKQQWESTSKATWELAEAVGYSPWRYATAAYKQVRDKAGDGQTIARDELVLSLPIPEGFDGVAEKFLATLTPEKLHEFVAPNSGDVVTIDASGDDPSKPTAIHFDTKNLPLAMGAMKRMADQFNKVNYTIAEQPPFNRKEEIELFIASLPKPLNTALTYVQEGYSKSGEPYAFIDIHARDAAELQSLLTQLQSTPELRSLMQDVALNSEPYGIFKSYVDSATHYAAQHKRIYGEESAVDLHELRGFVEMDGFLKAFDSEIQIGRMPTLQSRLEKYGQQMENGNARDCITIEHAMKALAKQVPLLADPIDRLLPESVSMAR